MPSMVDIKRRMKSIKGTQQMTKAMNLVASAKLGKAKGRLSSSRPFNRESHRLLSNVLNTPDKPDHPFFVSKEGKALFVTIAGDRGLCGGYNSNVIRETNLKIARDEIPWDNTMFFTVGKKCTEAFKKRNANILGFLTSISEKPNYYDARFIADKVIQEYLKGGIGKVFLVFTYFESIITHIPKVKTLLPIDPKAFKTDEPIKDVSIYEPNKEALLNYLLPKFLTIQIFDALVESAACEQGARMTSMDNATKNAKEALGKMTLLYNRARQAAITQEISEIVGGANAIQGG